ncbi:MAG: DUF3305 domain-containing protein [Paracoccaceae bacterium]
MSGNASIRPVVSERYESVGAGVVVRRQPGVTRWQAWVWRPVAVLPGAAPADWRLLRGEGAVRDYHAATLPLTLWRSDTPAYRVALAAEPPSLWVVCRPNEGQGPAEFPLLPFLVTASPFEAQDYADSGEETVEPLPMPAAVIGWVSAFVERHHVEEDFKKRRRDRVDVARVEDGRGDARTGDDVFRSPAARRAARGDGGGT